MKYSKSIEWPWPVLRGNEICVNYGVKKTPRAVRENEYFRTIMVPFHNVCPERKNYSRNPGETDRNPGKLQ